MQTIFLDGTVAPPRVDVVTIGAPGGAGAPRGNALLGVGEGDGSGGAAVPNSNGAVDGGG